MCRREDNGLRDCLDLQVFTDLEGKDPFLRSAKLDEDGVAVAPNLAVINVNLTGVLNTVHLAICASLRGVLVCPLLLPPAVTGRG